MKPLSKIIKLVLILLLTGTVLCAQDVQRFLGTYSVESVCFPVNAPGFILPPIYHDIVITEDIESDLLISFLLRHSCCEYKVEAFVLDDDSLFIPYQSWIYYCEGQFEDSIQCSFEGKGKISNDSISLLFFYGSANTIPPQSDLGSFVCNCKNKNNTHAIELQSESNQNKVYYDAINQTIKIEESLQNQFLILELYDMHGKVILKKTNINNSINIANLPNGVYLCRLLKNSQVIYSGKILK
jgi:hypothetical protein